VLWGEISREHDLPSLPFSNYQVSREGENEDEKIDLLLVADDRSWIIIVENKLFSPETGDQLDRYFSYIEKRYGDSPRRLYFYLTPDGIAPNRKENEACWLPISYRLVRSAVARFTSDDLPDRIRDFLDQYLEHIDRNVLKRTKKVAVGPPVARRPPHRSQRAGLPHWAPASGRDA